MNFVSAVILGFLQGMTEFLPVSSSGHLVIAQSFIPGFTQPGVLFDVILHLGTTVAVLFYFRKKIYSISKEKIIVLVIGTVPAGIIGVLFNTEIEALFSSVKLVGLALLATGLMDFGTDRFSGRKQVVSKLDGLMIGIGQAFAILPGVSRSGTTIFVGTSQGIRRQEAAEFSFLLSVPAIIGAGAVELVSHGATNNLSIFVYLGGLVSSFLTGILSISLVLRLLAEEKFKYFAVYCLIIGIAVLII
ncbi:MAG: Undecaprenyl-diphosphatase [Candidatus Woesebacteria bacterium GW2011_GWB1_43_14]|uniref:Undecaprenyl-diphosphatase n=1 Tax=Candidatus Woesebacteria bacterium GW2011_GWB1_43_14 TaxID=1618578 RepID=A0A0G1DI33_9BACT|nr:MAG: Undecaprenyl-diphosphatase [Candidatus Woesebacteria bacterium GW2011_GWA1_39_11b]KKS77486.1 MAG: Undecaprenyl-diphosphatase [Candidatus Woesebacteria bacterium GW2011_GWC1_42_9]KKS97334.1 MAG: Undecaprenyl-diphosphatase [Candidatus Woesebacteria bacterium GW2011_GWB1_43_14]